MARRGWEGEAGGGGGEEGQEQPHLLYVIIYKFLSRYYLY